MEVYRGDIFYVTGYGGKVYDAEVKQDRPAIVVSNNKANEHSPVIEVVFLTTAEKKKYLPTHVNVMCTVPSIALCEQVTSISKSRLSTYVRTANEKEMREIEKALLVSLGLDLPLATYDNCEVRGKDMEIEDLKMRLEVAYREMDDLKKQTHATSDSDEVVRLTA